MTPTMHDLYGDGSDHDACPQCGFCVTCCDCENYGCGLEADIEAMRTEAIRKKALEKRPDQGGVTNDKDNT